MLNIWQWNIGNQELAESTKTGLAKLIQFEIRRSEHEQRVDSRTFEQWAYMYLVRAPLVLINIISMLGGAAIIIASQLRKDELITYLDDEYGAQIGKYRLAKIVINLAPSFIVSIVNAVIPTITKFLILYERWDFPE